MKNIWEIFKTDFNNIKRNKSAIIVIVALMILPSMYAWFNILPSWDPYENTGDIAVAVVNLDEGATVDDNAIDIGDEVINSLKTNDKMGWQFVTEEEAMDGVEHGDYYAAIVIPKDFSENLTSVLDEEPTKPVLDYYINEKINAIAPKVTSSGASGVVESIESGFIKITNEAIFSAFNNIGIELEVNLPAIERFRDAVYMLEDELPEFEQFLKLADKNIEEIDKAVVRARDGVDKAEDLTEEIEDVSERIEKMLRQGDNTFKSTVPIVKQDLIMAQEVIQEVPKIVNQALEKGDDLDRFLDKVESSTSKIDKSTELLDTLIDTLEAADKRLTEDREFEKIIEGLKEELTYIKELINKINSLIGLLESGDHAGTSIATEIDELAKEVQERLEHLIELYGSELIPNVENLIERLQVESEKVKETISDINQWSETVISEVTKIIDNGGFIDVDEEKEQIETLLSAVEKYLFRVDLIVEILNVIQEINGQDEISKPLATFLDIQKKLQDVEQLLSSALIAIEKGEQVGEALWPKVNDIFKDINSLFNKELGQSIDRAIEDAISLLEKRDKELSERLASLHTRLDEVTQLTDSLVSKMENPEKTLTILQDLKQKMEEGEDILKSIIGLTEQVQTTIDDGLLPTAVERTEQLQADLNHFKSVVLDSVSNVRESKQKVAKRIDDINDLSKTIDQSITDLVNFIDKELIPKYEQSSTKAHDTLKKGNNMISKAHTYFPKIIELLEKADESVEKGKDGLEIANDVYPDVKEKIIELADRIRILEEKGDLQELINLMKNNPDAESDFFSDPIVLEEHELFPIPNYGSAMSPFFTSLALWVGALILVSSLIVDVPNKERYKSYEAYFGRFLLFWVIGIAQAFVVTMGNLFLLKTFVAHPFLFVLFGIIISTTFIVIVYTLVSVFGNTGKVIAIVLLVMQLGASGGTFPIQMTPAFFQKIHSFLPFTHALGLLREAVGGIIWKATFIHLAWLAFYVALFLFIGIKLKRHINKSSDKFLEEARESKVIL